MLFVRRERQSGAADRQEAELTVVEKGSVWTAGLEIEVDSSLRDLRSILRGDAGGILKTNSFVDLRYLKPARDGCDFEGPLRICHLGVQPIAFFLTRKPFDANFLL